MLEEDYEDENELPSSISKKNSLRSKSSQIGTMFENIFPNDHSTPLNLDNKDCSLIMLLLGISALTRTIRIFYPKNAIFNENVYITFTNNYLQGIFFTDNNPPLPKLIMSSIAYFAGYRGQYSFQTDTSYSSMFYVMLRIIPAFFSSFCVPISYITMRIMGIRHLGSACASLMICSDLILIVQGRHFICEGIVHFFSVLAIFSIFLYEQKESLISLFFEGICLGLSVSSKSTTGSIVLLAFLRQFPLKDMKNKAFFKNSGPSIIRCLILFIIIFTLYYSFYAIHISILPFKDISVDNNSAIPKLIKKSLIPIANATGNEVHNKDLHTNSIDWYEYQKNLPSLFIRVISLLFYNQKMSTVSNSNFNSSESYTSPWWTWAICMGKYVHIWEENNDHRIGCIFNVLLWIPVLIGIILSFFICIFQSDFYSQKAAMTIGYLISYLPFAFIRRELCIFHYMIPLFFGIYNLILLVDSLCSEKARGFFYLMLIHFSVTGYFLWSPLAYGKHVGDVNFLFWTKKWIQ